MSEATLRDGGPCCAHLRVNYKPVGNSDKTFSDRWECERCGHQFWPTTALATPSATQGAEFDALAFQEQLLIWFDRYHKFTKIPTDATTYQIAEQVFKDLRKLVSEGLLVIDAAAQAAQGAGTVSEAKEGIPMPGRVEDYADAPVVQPEAQVMLPSDHDLYASYANHAAIKHRVPWLLTFHSWKRENKR